MGGRPSAWETAAVTTSRASWNCRGERARRPTTASDSSANRRKTAAVPAEMRTRAVDSFPQLGHNKPPCDTENDHVPPLSAARPHPTQTSNAGSWPISRRVASSKRRIVILGFASCKPFQGLNGFAKEPRMRVDLGRQSRKEFGDVIASVEPSQAPGPAAGNREMSRASVNMSSPGDDLRRNTISHTESRSRAASNGPFSRLPPFANADIRPKSLRKKRDHAAGLAEVSQPDDKGFGLLRPASMGPLKRREQPESCARMNDSGRGKSERTGLAQVPSLGGSLSDGSKSRWCRSSWRLSSIGRRAPRWPKIGDTDLGIGCSGRLAKRGNHEGSGDAVGLGRSPSLGMSRVSSTAAIGRPSHGPTLQLHAGGGAMRLVELPRPQADRPRPGTARPGVRTSRNWPISRPTSPFIHRSNPLRPASADDRDFPSVSWNRESPPDEPGPTEPAG